MQFAPQDDLFRQSVAHRDGHRRNSQILLIGFDAATSAMIRNNTATHTFAVQACAEPFDGLAALIDDPGIWMTCIANAKAFASEIAFQTFLQLFSFEGKAVGMILANVETATHATHPAEPAAGIDMAISDVLDPTVLLDALTEVMARRGYGDDGEPAPSNWKYPATSCNSSHSGPRRSLAKQVQNSMPTHAPGRGRNIPLVTA